MAIAAYGFLREPLVHFIALGALVFAARALFAAEADSQQRIVVTAAIKNDLGRELRQRLGREPSGAELEVEVERWKTEEVLYREGLRLGMDQGDPTVRDRIVRKMRDVQRQLVDPPEPKAAELDAWLASHAELYREPRRLDFEHWFFAGEGTRASERAGRALAALSAGKTPADPGDAFAAGRRFERRSDENLSKLFGGAFVARLAELERGSWQLVRSSHGLHVVRLERVAGGITPTRQELLPRLVRDWKVAHSERLAAATVGELGKAYEFEEAP